MKKKLNCILLVDDDPSTNFINRKIIQKAEITEQIEVALNGKEALDYLLTKAKPSLILLDLNMPVMDGWEFLSTYKKLKEKEAFNSVVVVLTTSSNPEDKRKIEQIKEVSSYKNKPLKIELLENIIKEYFYDYL